MPRGLLRDMSRPHHYCRTLDHCSWHSTPQSGLGGGFKILKDLEHGWVRGALPAPSLTLSPPYRWFSDFWPRMSTVLQNCGTVCPLTCLSTSVSGACPFEVYSRLPERSRTLRILQGRGSGLLSPLWCMYLGSHHSLSWRFPRCGLLPV